MADVHQVLATCPDCRVEAALLELVEVSRTESRVIEALCRLCGRKTEGGETALGRRFQTEAEVRAALLGWARREGEPDLALFCEAGFCGLSTAEVVKGVLARAPLETGFDVIHYLFPGMGGGGDALGSEPGAHGAGGAVVAVATRQATWLGLEDEDPPDDDGAGDPVPMTRPHTWLGIDAAAPAGMLAPIGPTGPAHQAAPGPEVVVPVEVAMVAIRVSLPARGDPPRVMRRALASVMHADGQVTDRERQWVDCWLEEKALPPLQPADMRIWRPTELGWPDAPEPIIDAMLDLCYADGMRDGTEWRVVREYARHWGVPLAQLVQRARRLDARHEGLGWRLVRRMRRVLFTQGGTQERLR